MAIVHISYSRDNIAHLGRVLDLAQRLTDADMETRLHELRDARQAADDAEPPWRRHTAAGSVLVVCSPAYVALLGGQQATQQWFGTEVSAVAVLFDSAHAPLVIWPLVRHQPYLLTSEADYQRLLSDLRDGTLNPVRPAMAAGPADPRDCTARGRPQPTGSAGGSGMPPPRQAGRPAAEPWSGKLARWQTALRGVFMRSPAPVESPPAVALSLPRGSADDARWDMPTRPPVDHRPPSAMPTQWPDDASEGIGPIDSSPCAEHEQPAAAMAPPDTAAGEFDAFVDTWPGSPLELLEPRAAAAEPPADAAPAAASTEPVWFGVNSPRRAAPGDQLTAALATYIASRRLSAQDKLQAFGEPDDRQVLDLAPDGDAYWALGAPVTVTLSGRHLTVQPPRREFLWNGKENLAAFEVSVAPDAPAGKVTLTFQVALAGVPMAFVPMPMEIGAAGIKPDLKATAIEQQQRAPRSAFASYSSADAAEVTGRLSTLQRWSPGLAIFQDCLDLQPNEAFKPQLEHEIEARDVFLLFWSTHAAASQWVRWEYDRARASKGLDAIVPMPLQDPSIARPPPEFEAAHLRDRFMMAGYALQAIRQQAAAAPPT